MSGDPEQEYFADGITEDIITDLSKVSALFVAARNSTFLLKGKAVDIEEAGRRFKVAHILEGSVRKAAGRVRVTAQLIDAKTGGHLWAERYDRDLTDIFAIQDEIARSIVEQLKVKLLPSEAKAIASAPTGNLEAYEYYLKGRQFFHRIAKSYVQLARRMFEKAVEIDPNYARAHAGIADCDCILFFNHDIDLSLDEVLARTERALTLDPDLAEAHASRGLTLGTLGRNDEAIAAFDRALTISPELFEAVYFYARYSYMRREFGKGIELFERAAELRPGDSRATSFLADMHLSAGRREEGEKWAKLTVERATEEFADNPENALPATRLAGALAHLGRQAEAIEWAGRAIAVDPDDVNVKYNLACVYAVAGETDRAFDILEPLTQVHVARASRRIAGEWLENDPMLDSIRQHPRYQGLMQMLGKEVVRSA